MKRLAMGIVVPMTLILLSAGFSAAKDMTYTGEIMDSQCAKMGSHEKMMKMHEDIKTAKQCTLGCVKMGGKFVLFNPTTKKVYQLDDQQKPIQFAGEKVKVTGTYDKATDTIHVTDIQGRS